MEKLILTDRGFIGLEELILKVKEESDKQIKKWGIQSRSPFEWLTYTTEELGELAEAISEKYYRNGSYDEVIKEAIQTATLSLKIAEMYLWLKQTEVVYPRDDYYDNTA